MRTLSACLLLILLLPATTLAVFGDEDHDTSAPVIREIVLEGNERTDSALILREMGLRIGQTLSRAEMNDVWIHLEDIGWFAFVDMEFDDSNDDGVILRVYLEEDMTMAYGPLVRFDRRHKYQLGGWIEETNLRGQGERLRLEVGALYAQHAALRWSHPWFLGWKGLRLKLGLRGESSNFVYRPTHQKLYRGTAGLRWDLPRSFFVESSLTFGNTHFDDSYQWAYRGTPGTVRHEAGDYGRLAATLTTGVDTRDNPWYPSHGILAQADLTRWSGDGFDSYNQGDAEVRVFAPLPIGEHVLALRAWGRRVSGPAPLDNYLFFGGPETVRGYQYAGWEGDEGYLLSVEYRIPLFIMPISPRGESVGLGLHAFADAGDTWFQENEPQRALQSWGAGAHLVLDTMQLRFEAAKTREGDWVFEFMDHFNF